MRLRPPQDVTRDRSEAPYSRATEIELALQWLEGGSQPVLVAGPKGVGKTRLLRALGKAWEARGGSTHWMDASQLPSDASVVRGRLRKLEEPPGRDGIPALLLLDNFDTHAPLYGAYRDALLPLLGDGLRVVLSATEEPATVSGDGAADGRIITLLPLSNTAAAAYLSDHGSPEPSSALMEVAGGLPLMLATLVEFAGESDLGLRPGDDRRSPIEVAANLALQEAPSEEHRRGLWAIALPAVLSQRLLASMLDHARCNEVYRWLSSRAYVQSVDDGLVVHDLFRAPLLHDLMLRSQHVYREFLLRAGRFFIARADGHKCAEDRRAAGAALFFLQRRQYPLSASAEALLHSTRYVDDYRASDASAVNAMVQRFERGASAALAERWRTRFASGLRVFRDQDGQAQAFVQSLTLEAIEPRELATDPVLVRVRDIRDQQTQRRRHRRVPGRQRSNRQTTLVFRHWLDAAAGHNGGVGRMEIVREMAMQVLSMPRPGLAVLVAPATDPGFAEALQDMGLARRYPGDLQHGDPYVGGEALTLLGHDFAEEPRNQWLRRVFTHAMNGGRRPPRATAQPLPLARADFQTAVVDALQGYFDASALAANPLAAILAPSHARAGDGTSHDNPVQAWLQDGLVRLEATPGGQVYAAQLRRRFFARAAASAGAQHSRELATAIELLVATLWDAPQATADSS